MFHSSRVKIEVLTTGEDNKSAPKYVLSRLDTFCQKYELTLEDVLCIVFDVDRWKTQELKTICQEARQKKYLLSISNPCFEVWLNLHLDDLNDEDKECKDFQKRLREKLGAYNKANLKLDDFEGCVEKAIERAKNLHSNPKQNWPPTPGSHVYRIVEVILKATQK